MSASVVGASGAAGSGLAGGSGAIASGTVTSSGADGAVPRDGGALAGPKCAPTPTKLIDASEFMANANGVSAAMDLAVSATDLYVAVNYNQGGAVLSVPTDGQNVYFATPDGTQSVPLAGGMVQTLTTHTGALTVAGANIVIADSSAGGIFSVPIEGGPATLLATSPAGDLGPVLNCGADICWASAVEVSPSQVGTATLVQLGPMGVPATLSEDPALYVVYRLVSDGSEFFATMLRDLSFGSLATIPAAGGPPFSMGPGSGLAIDDECLYVADAIGGVYSVAKSYRGTVVVPP